MPARPTPMKSPPCSTAATHVLEQGQGWEGEFGTWSDHHAEGLTAMAEAITRHGAIGLAQLFHGGMRAPEALTGVQPMSASVNELGGDLGTSQAMSEQNIREVIDGFGAAAQRCEQAGFHGVELHGAHGYLIAQFLGAGTNRRTDAWGGSQQKRTQLLAEIISEVRRQTGPNFLVGVRLSPELKACGMNLADSLETPWCSAFPALDECPWLECPSTRHGRSQVPSLNIDGVFRVNPLDPFHKP